MDYRQILSLLAEKREKFLEIERVTEPMFYAQVDAIAECMEKRESLLNEVSEIDSRLAQLTEGQEQVKAALSHKCERRSLSPDLAEIYDGSMGVKAVVNRIVQNESGVRLHMEAEKQRIGEELEKLGQSASSVAGQYYNFLRTDRGYMEKKI